MAHYTLSIHLEVSNAVPVLEAGAQHLFETGSVNTIEEGRAAIGGDVTKALRFLIDPGQAPCAGLSILDSDCE